MKAIPYDVLKTSERARISEDGFKLVWHYTTDDKVVAQELHDLLTELGYAVPDVATRLRNVANLLITLEEERNENT